MSTRTGFTFDVYDTPAELDPSEPLGQPVLTLNPLTFWVFTSTGYVAVGTPTGDAPPSTASEAGQGIVELATEAEVQAGTTGILVATVARLKAELDRRAAVEAWIAPTLTSGWTNFGAPFAVAGYYKDPAEQVHIKGLVKNGTTGSAATIFTLPAGYRPAADERFAQAGGSGTFAVLDVQSDGRVVPLVVSNNANLSLSATFRVA